MERSTLSIKNMPAQWCPTPTGWSFMTPPPPTALYKLDDAELENSAENEDAAISIQLMFRGYKARKEANNMLEACAWFHYNRDLAACLIQRIFRGNVGRDKACEEQAWVRYYKFKAACYIQEVWRDYHTRKAAVYIQAIWRRYKMRNQLILLRALHEIDLR